MATKSSKSIERIWQFDVSDPTRHPDGFTVYKVSCKVFQVKAPDSLTEIIVWKRYNDFKNLFRAMLTLHKALHRKEEFPKFAKPKLFGRFEDSVIEERRLSALELLNFVGNQSYLYKSKAFQEFIKDGKIQHGISGDVLKPSKLDILTVDVTSSSQSGDASHEADRVLEPGKHPPCDHTGEATDLDNPEGDVEQSDMMKEVQLEGVWNFPQVPDNISLNSYDDDAEEMDVESTLSTSLPDTDIACFDPLSTSNKVGNTPDIHTSGSWLFAAMNTCAEMESEDVTDSTTPSDTEAGIQIDFDSKTEEMTTSTDTVKEVKINHVDTISESSSMKSSTTDLSEFDPLKNRSDSRVEYGKGDLDLSLAMARGGSSSCSTTSSTTSSPLHQVGRSPQRLRSHTGESVSTMDLGGKEDYIYVAANQICQAQDHEANGRYELAFSCYKSGVGILLQGVQGDKNKARRDAVRRKTAQYLIKAEDLYNRHLATESLDQKRWATDGDMSPLSEVDPSLALLKGSTAELKNYKVLGTVDKVLLVMDKNTDETYIMKTVHKSSTCSKKLRTILPVSCPYMVGLHRFFETDNAIHLLLQYATGGKLWTYIGAYLHSSRNNQKDNVAGLVTDRDQYTNAYMGQKIHSSEDSQELHQRKSDLRTSEVQDAGTREGSDKDIDGVTSHMKYSKENETCVYGHTDLNTSVDVFGFNIPNGELGNCDGDKNVIDDKSVQQMTRPRYRTLSSISSDNQELGEMDSQEFKPCIMDHKDFKISDIIENTKSNLECFSINSVDSNDGVQRMDSNTSDSAVFQCIPEESEVSPSHKVKSRTEDDVFSGGIDTHQKSQPNVHGGDADMIVQNAKELLKTVERTLSLVDAEVEEVISPKKLSDFDVSNSENRDIASDKQSAKDVEDYDSANETSIYDLNRSSEGQSSDTSDGEQVKSPEKQLESLTDVEVNDSKERTNTLVKINSDSEFSISQNEHKESRSSTLTEHSLTRHPTPPKRLSLMRMNSKELSRSASMERELISPLKIKQRSFSGIFQELDPPTNSPEQVRLPESCIQQWAAEIVVALSRLHAEGILCRDLKPDNLLLGERGHVLLTYFCQISTTEKDIDYEAVEQLYVAPEVRSICGYTDVCDWWSLGALLYELLTGRSLLSCHPGGITSHTQLYIPDTISSEGRGLLDQLLCFNPRERLGAGINGAEEIKAHPFFSGINWHAMETMS